MQKVCLFSLVGQWALFTQKLIKNWPAWSWEVFSLPIRMLPTFWAELIFILRICFSLPIAPPRVDKQLGWVVRNPRFRPNLNIQPIKRIYCGTPQPPNIDWKPFNLIWYFSDWLEHYFLEIWDFGKNARVPFFKKKKKTIQKWCLNKSSYARIQIPTFSHP